MTKLHVSPDLALPLDWMTLATVVYGARGSGKTTLGSVIAEEVTKAKQRFGAVDLKGDWYGLKSTADGKGDGIPVVVFGGDHADLPLEEGAGAFIAETVAGLEQPFILDLEQLSKGKQVRFLAAFFETLYDRNREPLLLLLDEAQRYAPQKPIDPDAAKCLGSVEDLVKLGRKHGIGPVLFTQRGSGLNKEVSELCDMMVAFRTPGPLDQDRVKDWLDANTTKAQRDEVMGALAGLPTGTAVFASGHPDLKIFGTYAVRRRETFDSSATPKVGHRKQEPKRLAKPDLEQLRTKMAAAIERQKADDPKALRAEIASMRKDIADRDRLIANLYEAAERAPTKRETKRVEIPVLKNGALRDLKKISGDWLRASEAMLRSEQAATERAATFRATAGELAVAIKPVLTELDRITSVPSELSSSKTSGGVIRHETTLPSPRGGHDGSSVRAGNGGGDSISRPTSALSRGSAPVRERQTAPGDRPARTTEGISTPQQRILDAAAFLEEVGIDTPDVVQLALFSGQSSSGGYWRANIGRLRTLGLIEGTRLTEAGRGAARPSEISTVEQLHEHVFSNLLRGAEKQILRVLIDAYPEAVTVEEVGGRAGLAPAGGYWRASVGRLRSLGLITKKGPMAALPVLFLEGGR